MYDDDKPYGIVIVISRGIEMERKGEDKRERERERERVERANGFCERIERRGRGREESIYCSVVGTIWHKRLHYVVYLFWFLTLASPLTKDHIRAYVARHVGRIFALDMRVMASMFRKTMMEQMAKVALTRV